MQTLGGLCHFDFAEAGAHSYEQAFLALRRLGMGSAEAEQQFRRMAFNIVARNQDDHVKNIAFLMDRDGRWSLSPAYDLTYSYSKTGRWTATHQMTMNGKRDDFTLADFEACAETAILRRGVWHGILNEVFEAVRGWTDVATAVGVPERRLEQIRATHRLSFPAA
jgi:serine/threonine-protein kinase HipA